MSATVRFRLAASGIRSWAITYPWSSLGTKLVGIVRNRCTSPADQHGKQHKGHRHPLDHEHHGIAEGQGKAVELAVEPGKKAALRRRGMLQQEPRTWPGSG